MENLFMTKQSTVNFQKNSIAIGKFQCFRLLTLTAAWSLAYLIVFSQARYLQCARPINVLKTGFNLIAKYN